MTADSLTFEQYRDFLIERGLKKCNELLGAKKGNMHHFYRGAIDEFEQCRSIPDIMDMENRLKELKKSLKEARTSSRTPDNLENYWYINGRVNQADFLFEHLKLLYLQGGDTYSARAAVDFMRFP